MIDREKIASVQHDIWEQWMKYLLSSFKESRAGNYIIPKEKVNRWYRQIAQEYSMLTENEKESDRGQADKVMAQFHENRNTRPVLGIRKQRKRGLYSAYS